MRCLKSNKGGRLATLLHSCQQIPGTKPGVHEKHETHERITIQSFQPQPFGCSRNSREAQALNR